MRVFVTGATGFIGSAVVRELIGAGHTVTGLARSAKAAQTLIATGAKPHLGALDDPDSLRRAASAADGVIHLAFIHGLSGMTTLEKLRVVAGGRPGGIVGRFMSVAGNAERLAIDALGAALQGSGRPLLVTFGTIGLAHDGPQAASPATEADAPDPLSPGAGRAVLEEAVQGWAERGVRAMAIRLPPSVHGEGDKGLVPQLIGIARKKGVSAYAGDGQNRWPAVHRLDAATLFRLALENGVPGARYHGVAEEGIKFRDIAALIGQRLKCPVAGKPLGQATAHFGWLGRFVATDNPTTSQRTREQLGWQPAQPMLLGDIDQPGYFDM
jgi:nucleoside-diphosphate-sugar epimerase